jgi:PAS domain S-box-containing protein
MDLHPGPEKRRLPEVKPELDPIQRALRDNEDWYQDLVEHSEDLLCTHDLQGRLLDINPAPARLLGYSVEELRQIPMREIVAPEFRPQFDAYLSQIENTGESRGFMAVMTRSGERRIWEYHNTLRTEGVASPIVRGTAHDVTEQKRAEKLAREATEDLLRKVRESESTIRELKLFRTLLDQSNDAIEVVDPETLHFLDVNEKACSDLGYSHEELLSMGVFDINPLVTESSAAKINEELRKSGSVVMESLHRRKDGSTFPVEVSMRRVRLDRDYTVAISRDLTERKQTEKRLGEYERVVEGLEEMIVVLDRDYRFVIANRAYITYRALQGEQVAGRLVAEVVGKSVFETTMKEKMDECFQGKVVRYEMRFKYPKLGERDLFLSYFPIEGAGGIDRIGVVLQDITERKRAEEALKKSEEKFSKAFRQSPMALTLTSINNNRYIEVNETFEHATGWRREEILGRTPLDIELWVNPAERMALAARLLRDGSLRNVETSFRMRDGSLRAVLITAEMIEVNGEPCAIGAAVDITERKQAEEALRRSEENYRLFVSQSSEGIFRQDLDTPVSIDLPEEELIHRILHDSYMAECNDAMARMYGLTSGREFVGKRLKEMLPPEDPHNIELTRHFIRSSFRVFERESHEVDVHGNPKVILNSMIGTVENGMLVRTWGIQRDVTEKVKLEESRRKAEEALRQSEERFRIALNGSPISVFNQDLDLRYTWAYSPHKGGTDSNYLGKTDEEIFGPDAAARITALKRRVLEAGRGAREEITIPARGKTYYSDLTVEPLRDEAGTVIGVTSACVNVTHLREVTEELRVAKAKLTEEKLYLEQTIDTELGFGEIIGSSGALKEVMAKVSKVAPSGATVLLLGETGTGKELVARAIHRMSKRKDSSFIKLNCAAIPSGLLESELFGHEKGAFTGAVARKLGRLELADHGTLFLDEIGEIPLGLQPKLLRVLQDQEFERLGGTQTLRVDFRLVAATNRDLQQSMNQREFRSDLYYRLNVFPIHLPPLRERREDIPLLVKYFVGKYADRMNKPISSIPSKTMEALMRWDWPGNIRELENLMERSVILTPGSVLQAPELRPAMIEGKRVTPRDKERERVVRALRDCHGQIGGPKGAAARLGLKRTTLQSKIDRFGIKPAEYREAP